MREMDLIPEDYRRNRSTRRQYIGFGVLYIMIIIGLVAGKIFQDSRTATIKQQIESLQKQQQTLIDQEKINDDLLIKKSAVENQLAFVKMIQQGGGADQIFLVFDRVLQHQGNFVWMEAWHYTAANLDTDKQDNQKQSADHMLVTIRGQALDHEALSAFVNRLISQPEITDVEVKNTSMIGTGKTTVMFDMEII